MRTGRRGPYGRHEPGRVPSVRPSNAASTGTRPGDTEGRHAHVRSIEQGGRASPPWRHDGGGVDRVGRAGIGPCVPVRRRPGHRARGERPRALRDGAGAPTAVTAVVRPPRPRRRHRRAQPPVGDRFWCSRPRRRRGRGVVPRFRRPPRPARRPGGRCAGRRPPRTVERFGGHVRTSVTPSAPGSADIDRYPAPVVATHRPDRAAPGRPVLTGATCAGPPLGASRTVPVRFDQMTSRSRTTVVRRPR